jgi:hypothetical protein
VKRVTIQLGVNVDSEYTGGRRLMGESLTMVACTSDPVKNFYLRMWDAFGVRPSTGEV